MENTLKLKERKKKHKAVTEPGTIKVDARWVN